MRLGVGDARLQADVGGHDRSAVVRRHPQVIGVVKATDVIGDDGTGGARSVEHARSPGVTRDGDVEAVAQSLDGADHAIQLLVLRYVGTGSGLHTADVDDVATLRDDLVGAP